MVRDTYRDEAYFRAYIQTQEKRITKFEGAFQTLKAFKNQAENPERVQECARFLLHFYRDFFCAQYSCGEPKGILEGTFRTYLSYARELNSLSWSDAVELLSLAILFQIDIGEEKADWLPEDALVETLFYALKGFAPARKRIEKESICPAHEMPFLRCLLKKDGQESLRLYLRDDWYEENSEASWYGAEKRNDGTYCGCWCYIGAAVVKLCDYEVNYFQNVPYFPIDLL